MCASTPVSVEGKAAQEDADAEEAGNEDDYDERNPHPGWKSGHLHNGHENESDQNTECKQDDELCPQAEPAHTPGKQDDSRRGGDQNQRERKQSLQHHFRYGIT